MSLLIRNARIVTVQGPGLASGDLLVEGERITGIGEQLQAPETVDREIDAAGRVLMPAFADCHTHACFAGDRLDEWDLKRRGATYLEILESGGGIMSTVRAVRAATPKQLADGVQARLEIMLREGTTTVEVKSGYGLSTEHELKMLRAIADAGSGWAGTVVPTALLGHAIDPEIPDFFEHTISATLDAVHTEFPGIAIDVFCEKGAWPVEESVRLLRRARELGHPVRAHVDQFNSLGMVKEAIELGARSVDHLEASGDEELRLIAGVDAREEQRVRRAELDCTRGGTGVGTIGVGLPMCGLHVDGRYANLRRLIDLGGRAAIATNFNPGSAPSSSMPLAIGLAVRHCGLTPEEAIEAGTSHAAAVLNLPDRGALSPGMRADLVLLRHTDPRMLAYEIGGDPVDAVVCAGRLIRGG
ncbi:MAG: amidohydrolase family protein [Phycisphaerales bacterium]|nr:amidohydrolase family protein [Phycisphaerales bacterium]